MKHIAGLTFVLLLVSVWPAVSNAQNFVASEALPDSPGAALQSIAGRAPGAVATASISGIVTDTQGSIVPGATVILSSPGKLGEKTTEADGDGTFTFSPLSAGDFRLIITAKNFETYTSGVITLKSGEIYQSPGITLKFATSSSVNVYASADQVAEAQVQEQEKQRVLGVFPNFYTSYIWNAAPMTPKQKYRLAFRALADPVTFLTVAGIAGAEHFNGTYPGYGPGIAGFGKRYGAAYGDALTSRVVGSAILPSLLHQDPRYFYQGSGGARSRTWHALASAVVTRSDHGRLQPNYSHILGSLVAGAVANAYHPESSRGLGLTFETLGITTAGNAAGNLFREFVLRGLVPSVPPFANGKE